MATNTVYGNRGNRATLGIMDTPQQEHRPGDIILERYIPNASEEDREIARENLRRLARLLIRVHERLTLDNPEDAIRANADSKLESELLPSNV